MIFKNGKEITRIFHGSREIDAVFFKGREVFNALESKVILDAINRRAVLEGFALPSGSVQSLMRQYLQGMIDAGLWEKYDLFMNFAYNALGLNGYRRINWKNPEGNLATMYGAIQDNIKGIGGNGINAYVDTNHNMTTHSINYKQNNAGLGTVNYSVPASQNTNTEVFASYGQDFLNGLRMTFRTGVPIPIFINSADYGASTATINGIGYKALNRYGSSIFSVINKDVLYNNNANSNAMQSRTLKLLVSNNGFSTFGMSGIWIGASLTFDENQTFRMLTNKFLTQIGLDPFA